MKKLFVIMIMFFVASTTFAQITGSAHDFSGASWNGSSDEICITCHTPHAAADITNTPLWNHENTVFNYTDLYSNNTLDATVGQPAGISKLCLSCHDGTVAMDNFGGATGGTTFISGDALIGTDLSNDHPVSFTYDATLATTTDGGLHDPSNSNSGLGGTIAADMLISNQMECSSCHDVHAVTDVASLLVKSNTASALCLTCHDK